MNKKSDLKRVIKGAVAGAVAGIVASWAANQFHSVWSLVAGEEQNPEVARLSDRGGRPDTAAAKERAASGGPPQEDATVAIASKGGARSAADKAREASEWSVGPLCLRGRIRGTIRSPY
jgi:hypothetical protein